MKLLNYSSFLDTLTEINETAVLFDFYFIGLKFKCLYIIPSTCFIISVENKNIGFAFNISENGTFNGKTPRDFYNELKFELKKNTGEYKISPLFECLGDRILGISSADFIIPNNSQIIGQISLTKNKDKDYDNDGDNPYFENWYRHRVINREPSQENLEKTERFFGIEIMQLCKKNKISSQWGANPSKKTLDLLKIDSVKNELTKSD